LYTKEGHRLMRWFGALLIGAALLTPLSGCRSCAPVERTLRQRENELRDTKEELDRQIAINRGLQLELETQHAPPGVPGVISESPGPVYPVRSIALGRQTGGVEDNAGYGDQALQVIVQPLDADGSAIKVPSSLLVQVIEVSPEGLKRPLSAWEVNPDQLSRTWRTGLLSTGYALTFPWKIWPTTEKLRVVAQLRLLDGRVFEADRDVTIRLPSPSQRRIMPPAEPTSIPPPPSPPADVLPPPSPPADVLPPPPQPVEGPSLDTSAKPHFDQVQRDPVAIPNWNDPWRPAASSTPPGQIQRPIAREN
jgi:hypothetical protein